MSCLYIVGTPIGNLLDISKRAIDTLKAVDFIIAEDCRVSLKMLNSYCIKKPLFSFHKFSNEKRANTLICKIKNGETAALISDAGMPLISDPGDILIHLCHENCINVKVVPGPCAFVAALCVSGMDCKSFTFFGFLPTNNKSRIDAITFLKTLPHTIVLYESPHRLVKTLKDIFKHLQNRKIAIVKELTKIYESVEIFTISEALKYYENKQNIKGEYVLIIEGCKYINPKNELSLQDAIEFAKHLIKNGEKPSLAAKKAATMCCCKKSDIYKNILTDKTKSKLI